MYIKDYILFGILFFFTTISFAQEDKLIKKGDLLFEQGNVIGARYAYEEAFRKNKDNAYTNLQIAKCYLLSAPKTKALMYANNALKLSTKPSNENYFVLAQSLHQQHQFDEAIKYYTKSDPANKNKKAITKFIKECEHGKQYIKDPSEAKVINAGQVVNTEHNEYLPYITADLSNLFFTSRRPGSVGSKKAEDGMLYEDIYFCKNKGGAWDTPENIASLNTEGHDACAGISEDGQTMFVYKGTNGGDLYSSELKGRTWSKPSPLPFNTPGFESTASLSPDGKTLYFVYAASAAGNRDIYMCFKTTSGAWSKPLRVSGINTEYDEDAPYIHPDGKTLYFSSKGHSSMGGYDVFKTTKSGGTWSTPINLGSPVNTAGDEIYFVLSADGTRGFYSSEREGGFGKQDLYSIRLPVGTTEPELELLTGTIKDASTSKGIEAEITITDNSTKEILSKTRSNSEDGRYLIALPCGKNYGIAIEKTGHLFHSENVNLPCGEKFIEIKKEIKLVDAKPGAKVVLKNIFFDSGKSDLRPESIPELNRLIKLLQENSTLRIEVSGHTDNIGDVAKNMALSELRSQAVVGYLTNNGIKKERLKAKGYGQSLPIDNNDTELGRQNNRRTEFKVL